MRGYGDTVAKRRQRQYGFIRTRDVHVRITHCCSEHQNRSSNDPTEVIQEQLALSYYRDSRATCPASPSV